MITAGHGTETARTISVNEEQPINAPALTMMLKQIVSNNRAGGWGKLQANRLPSAPASKESSSWP